MKCMIVGLFMIIPLFIYARNLPQIFRKFMNCVPDMRKAAILLSK
jgi:hypothetical protein